MKKSIALTPLRPSNSERPVTLMGLYGRAIAGALLLERLLLASLDVVSLATARLNKKASALLLTPKA